LDETEDVGHLLPCDFFLERLCAQQVI
jgi:hypothetical protein